MSCITGARGAVAEVKKLGLISGEGANTFDPNGLLTRAEAVLFYLLAYK
ncbi:S-layer homology domain-containing protein [Paenibacillus sp. CCS19]